MTKRPRRNRTPAFKAKVALNTQSLNCLNLTRWDEVYFNTLPKKGASDLYTTQNTRKKRAMAPAVPIPPINARATVSKMPKTATIGPPF